MTENEVATVVVDSAVEVHRVLGPGLLESVYEKALAHELTLRGMCVDRQVEITARYKGEELGASFRADIIVNQCVLVELKALEANNPAHKKQVLTHLRLTGLRLGFLMNFGADLMRNGIFRIVNGLNESPPTTPSSAPSRAFAPLRDTSLRGAPT